MILNCLPIATCQHAAKPTYVYVQRRENSIQKCYREQCFDEKYDFKMKSKRRLKCVRENHFNDQSKMMFAICFFSIFVFFYILFSVLKRHKMNSSAKANPSDFIFFSFNLFSSKWMKNSRKKTVRNRFPFHLMQFFYQIVITFC